MTDLKALRQIVKMMVDNGLTEVDLEADGEKIKLKRGPGGEIQYVTPTPSAAPVAPSPGAAPAASAAPTDDDDAGDAGGGETVDSPMVGTFYAAPSPDADNFVSVGDRVSPDTVVCIIEAMKVFNEIKAEKSGTVVSIEVGNASPVEYGQVLIKIRPN